MGTEGAPARVALEGLIEERIKRRFRDDKIVRRKGIMSEWATTRMALVRDGLIVNTEPVELRVTCSGLVESIIVETDDGVQIASARVEAWQRVDEPTVVLVAAGGIKLKRWP